MKLVVLRIPPATDRQSYKRRSFRDLGRAAVLDFPGAARRPGWLNPDRMQADDQTHLEKITRAHTAGHNLAKYRGSSRALKTTGALRPEFSNPRGECNPTPQAYG